MGYAQTKKGFLGENAGKPISKDQLSIVRKVYSILAAGLAITAATAFWAANSGIVAGSTIWWVALLSPLALIWPILSNESETAKAGFCILFAVCQGLTLGVLYDVIAVQQHYYSAWWASTGITVATFGGLTSYVWATREDFCWMRGTLFTMLLVMVIMSGTSLILGLGIHSEIFYNVFGVGLFSAYILLDTSDVLHRGEKSGVFGPFALALGLYLDILNMFLHVLQLLMKLLGKNND